MIVNVFYAGNRLNFLRLRIIRVNTSGVRNNRPCEYSVGFLWALQMYDYL